MREVLARGTRADASRDGGGRAARRRLVRVAAAAGSTRTSTARSTLPGAAVLDAAWSRDRERRARRRCSAGSSPSSRSSCPTTRRSRRRLERVQRRVVLVRRQGPPHAARAPGEGAVRDAVLRRGRRRDVRGVAVGARSTRRPRRSRRRRAPTRPPGAPTRPRSGSRSRRGSSPTDALDRTSRRSSRRSRSARTGSGATAPPRRTGVGAAACGLGRLRRDASAVAPHAGPDLGAARGARGARASRCSTTARPTSSRCLRTVAQERLREVFRTENEVLVFTVLGHGRVRVGGRQPPLAGRARARRLARGVRRALAEAGRAPTAATSMPLAYAWGESPAADDLRRALGESGARGRASSSTRRRRPVSSATSRRSLAACARGGRALRRRRDLEPRRGAARDGRLGRRRRRHRLAEGADDARRASAFVSVSERAWERSRDGDAAALLLGLGAPAPRAGEGTTRRSRRPSRRSSRSIAALRPRCSTKASRPRSRGTSRSVVPAARA